MGGGKKFIDKRSAAHFHLMPCPSDTVDSGGRVFVRTDNNPYPDVEAWTSHSIQRETSEADDLDGLFRSLNGDRGKSNPRSSSLPEHVRKEILDLGLPDDGYNYLLHLREIRPSGAGATLFENPAPQPRRINEDVKAYDATKVNVRDNEIFDDADESGMVSLALRARSVRVQKAVDPDVAKLLEDSESGSKVASDDEDLEEDFVLKANMPSDGHEDDDDDDEGRVDGYCNLNMERKERENGMVLCNDEEECSTRHRTRTLYDEQFERVLAQEYGESEDEEGIYSDADEESELAEKLGRVLKEFNSEKLDIQQEYRVPADLKDISNEPTSSEHQDIIRKCAEYAESYLNGSGGEEDLISDPESSDESDHHDCETIVSTYSNLDNHPGKIQAPINVKKRLLKLFPGENAGMQNAIKLQGKEMLPQQYLNRKQKKVDKENKGKSDTHGSEKPRTRHPEESKEEKKERKAAVKEAKKEARRAKKELKGLYKNETMKAQKVVALSVPSSVHPL